MPTAIHSVIKAASSCSLALLFTAVPPALATDGGATVLPSAPAPAPAPVHIERLKKDAVLRPVAVPTLIELETLVPRSIASAGEVSAQAMAGFGGGWSKDAQLFWRPPPPVETPIRSWPNLTLYPEVAKPGRYRVTLVHTVAPDYGIVRMFLKGQPVKDFDGYGPDVLPRRLELGEFQLAAGKFQLMFTVFARNPTSSAHFVGLDRIELLPVD